MRPPLFLAALRITAAALSRYFRLWLDRLGVDEAEYRRLAEVADAA